MIKKKVLVTGANGTLGSEIINQLKKRKINYVGLYSKKTNITNYNTPVSYTHLRAHETKANLVCRLLLEKKKKKK